MSKRDKSQSSLSRGNDINWLAAWNNYLVLAGIDPHYDPPGAIQHLRDFIERRLAQLNPGEMRQVIAYLFDLLQFLNHTGAPPVRYEGDDPLYENACLISYSVTFSSTGSQAANYQQLGVQYPAPPEVAAREILPQFIYAVESGPSPEDLRDQHVDYFTPEELRRTLAHLWHYRRLSPERYIQERTQLFRDKWATIRDTVIEDLREHNRRSGKTPIDPTRNEIVDKRKSISRLYRLAIQRAFERTEERLDNKRADLIFRLEPRPK